MKFNIKVWSISLGILVMFAALLFPLLTQSAEEPFTQAKLDALNQAGQPVLVAIHASWCSTCLTQERILQELLPQPEFKRIKLLRVDFDQQKEVVRSFGVQYQSTLIAFKHGREVGRMTAEMSQDRIAELLRLSL
ncbi:MAG: thioredoxin family protein [Gallionellaceae bacterium]